MLYAVVAATILLGLAFTVKWDKSDQNEEVPIYIKYADSITNPYIKDMCKQHNLSYFGGGGGFLYNVENINIKFISKKQVDIEQARNFLITCSEELLERINTSDKIRPYLDHYPFTKKGIQLDICYFDQKGTWNNPRFIAQATASNGYVYYAVFDHKKRELKTIYKESYQDALKIAQSHNGNLPFASRISIKRNNKKT